MALKDDANELKGIFQDLKNLLTEQSSESQEMLGNFDSSKQAMQALVDVAEEYAKKQKDLSLSEADALSKKLEKNKEILKLSQSGLNDQIQKNKELQSQNEKIIKKSQENLKTLRQGTSERKFQEKLLKRTLEKQANLTQKASQMKTQFEAASDAINDIDGSVEDLGYELDATFTAKTAVKEFKKVDKVLEPFKKGLGNIFDGPTTGVMNMLNPLNIVASLIGGLVGETQEYDKRLGDTAKSMGLTYDQIEMSNREMARFTETTDNTIISAKDLNKTVSELNQTLGTQVLFEDMGAALKEDVSLMAQLEQGAGLTAEETQGIMKFSMATGKEAKNVTKQIMAGFKVRGLESKLILNEKEAMKAISKTSKATQLSISGGAEGLGRALASAKALGTSLDKVDGIAGSILNFEQSIADELEAELLVGKDLNLEKARQAAMDGELGILADEIAKNVGSAADFTKMNRVQQEALATAVGMTREELAGSLMEQEALKAVSADSVDDAYAMLQSKTTEAEKQAYLNELGNESLANQLEQRSIAEEKEDLDARATQSMVELGLNMAKAREIMRGIMDIVQKVLDAFGGIKGVLIIIGGLMVAKVAKGMYDFLNNAKTAYSAVKSLAAASKADGIASIVSAAYKTYGGLPLVGAGIAAAVAAGGIMYLTSQMSQADDMFSPGSGGYGSRTLMGPEGAIALNNKDDIVAGTDLFKNNSPKSPPQTYEGPNMSSVVAAINTLGAKVEAMANRPINVGIDGKKVIEAGTGNNPNTFGEEVGKNSFELQ